jgi:hypothetical protein
MSIRSRTDSREEQPRSRWASICILAVVLLFGLFWIWQKRAIAPTTAITPPPQPVVQTATTTPAPAPAMSDLEASAVNLTIPSFEHSL